MLLIVSQLALASCSAPHNVFFLLPSTRQCDVFLLYYDLCQRMQGFFCRDARACGLLAWSGNGINNCVLRPHNSLPAAAHVYSVLSIHASHSALFLRQFGAVTGVQLMHTNGLMSWTCAWRVLRQPAAVRLMLPAKLFCATVA